jgi:hypothetical protein
MLNIRKKCKLTGKVGNITSSIYIINKSWLVGGHMVIRDFGPYGIIIMNVCLVITVGMIMHNIYKYICL